MFQEWKTDADRQVQLLRRILRELVPGLLTNDRLVDVDETTKCFDRQLDVGLDAGTLLHLLERVLEVVAGQAEDGLAEHLDQPPVGVPREVVVVGLGGEAGHARVIETDVQDRLHHAGHREARAGPHRHQQRVLGVAELAAHRVLEPLHVPRDLGAQALRTVAVLQEVPARLRRDGESGRDRQPHAGHLGQVGALAAQQVLLGAVAVGEVVDVGVGLGGRAVGRCHGPTRHPRG